MKFTWAALALSAGLIVSGAAFAEEPRYSMTQTDGGFLRLNNETGEVSHCQERAGGFTCELAADERTAYENQIAALTERLERLEAKTPAERAGIPTDAELDEAFGFFEAMSKRLARAARIFGDEMQKMDEELQQNPFSSDDTPEGDS
jgi:hypothetical protein